ncbi:hypothetical protein [Pseudomonas sp. GV071]|uniref:glycosyltransferase n=1 Tax=Pseudomonas sp. GV071 TaxID=2135754 RepID=UPI000D3D7A9F|nr:hypothetical protein [Pseudomonas sp. GV071]PTQ67906.1 glycosyltransferase involved in cell wall biosynthesis [Pseudomonas sp. GV071]
MNAQLSVAAPWSLTHYMPLNGFHPLYRALFESKPEWVTLSAWDNIKLSRKLRSEHDFRKDLLQELARDKTRLGPRASPVQKGYFKHFWQANFTLTRLLPGEIEFHHTAPFPSLKRPFVFHCEAFAPIFFPLAHQGSGGFDSREVKQVRDHYRAIFEHPLCLGIFSHIPQTLDDIRRFFLSPIIDSKLRASRIGLHGSDATPSAVDKNGLDAPILLFVNSANQNPKNFFLRGGHLALRYWQRTYPEPGAGRLIMRCARPLDSELAEYRVDLQWLRRHEGRSVIWIENYLSEGELDALMQAAHVLLLPSVSLHSVSIMSAMAAGAVPVVSDTVGTDRYVADAVDGVVLRGIYANNWRHDADTGLVFNRFQRSHELEDDLVEQLTVRVGRLLANPAEYAALQRAALSKARDAFSGIQFCQDFWSQVQQCYESASDSSLSVDKANLSARRPLQMSSCLVDTGDWPRLFTSAPQPVPRLDAGSGGVTELGGCVIFNPSGGPMPLYHWSPIARYIDHGAPSLTFAASIKGLKGCYLITPPLTHFPRHKFHLLKDHIANVLMPYPRLFSAAVISLNGLRRARRVLGRILPGNDAVTPPQNRFASFDIQLVAANIKGLNVIRHGDMFYAISPSVGEFNPELAEAGKYDPCMVGTTLKDLLRKLEELPGGDDVEVVEKAVAGFNLVRYGSVFYAIPELEGEFDIARVQAGFYSRIHSGQSADTVKAAIIESAL